MPSFKLDLPKEKANLITYFIASLMVIIGIALLYWASLDNYWKNNKIWQEVVRQLGSLIFVTVVITLLWQLWGKRAFLDEVIAKAGLSKEIIFTGIVKITDNFYRDIEWESYFRTVNKLDILFAYGRTWRNTYNQELQEVASREGARIRIILPDPEDENVVNELARRFNCAHNSLIREINEAKDFFMNLRSSSNVNEAQINIWFSHYAPIFTVYRFDNVGIISLYSHTRGLARVPAFVCKSPGSLFDYVYKELNVFINEDEFARCITAQ